MSQREENQYAACIHRRASLQRRLHWQDRALYGAISRESCARSNAVAARLCSRMTCVLDRAASRDRGEKHVKLTDNNEDNAPRDDRRIPCPDPRRAPRLLSFGDRLPDDDRTLAANPRYNTAAISWSCEEHEPTILTALPPDHSPSTLKRILTLTQVAYDRLQRRGHILFSSLPPAGSSRDRSCVSATCWPLSRSLRRLVRNGQWFWSAAR